MIKLYSQSSNTIGMFEDVGTFSTTTSPTPKPLKIAAIDSLSPFQSKNHSIQNNLSIQSMILITHPLYYVHMITNC